MRVELPPEFGVRVVDDRPLRLEVTGPLDTVAARLLDGLLDAVRDADDEPVVLDLSGAQLLDPAGLEAVMVRIGSALQVIAPA